jgi:NAD(P)H-hydrate epimerase
MTAALPETKDGTLARCAFDRIGELAQKLTLVAIGPGLGQGDETKDVALRVFRDLKKPVVIDADGLNSIAGESWTVPDQLRVLTPHPGEMSRLNGQSVREIQADRIAVARRFATDRNVTLVLKGEGTLIGFPDGRVWINPTGSPSMATGGTGDILTGTISGLLAQFPNDPDTAIAAAVYLHGLAGEIAARHLAEQPVIATDLLRYFGEGIRAITQIPDQVWGRDYCARPQACA